MLYTLTPEKSSSFKDIRLCKELCNDSLVNDFEFIVPADPDAKEGDEGFEEQILTDPFEMLSQSLSGGMLGLS